jgi:hypothetical protein
MFETKECQLTLKPPGCIAAAEKVRFPPILLKNTRSRAQKSGA